MQKPYLSVIVPTYNRAEKLDLSLGFLYEQNILHESYEVIVIDDGSTDETYKILEKWASVWPQFKSFSQKNSKQAIARNNGIRLAEGQIILMVQDDIYASKDFLKAHIDFHQENPDPNFACLGLTEWWPESKITKFMIWLTSGGPQFAYHKLKANQQVSYWFFYTSNISLKSEKLKANLFDEDFKAYGWEDIELGFRLMQKNLKLIFNPLALAWHDHFIDESDLKERMLSIGRGALLLESKCKDIKVLPKSAKLFIFKVLSSKPVLFILYLLGFLNFRLKNLYWYALSKQYFLKGIKSL